MKRFRKFYKTSKKYTEMIDLLNEDYILVGFITFRRTAREVVMFWWDKSLKRFQCGTFERYHFSAKTKRGFIKLLYKFHARFIINN